MPAPVLRVSTMRITLFFLLVTGFCNATTIRNVLFLVSDDLKASVLSCYGDKFCRTPNIDKLAKQGMLFDRAYCQGTVCGPSRQSFMFSRYKGQKGSSMAQHFKENGWYTARVGKIYHMRVPGDIIAGTNGVDHPPSWTERFNSQGMEAHTPGNYACLNLNDFKRAQAGRQSTKMKHRMFVTVETDSDGSGQPDYKTATKTIALLQEHKDKPFFLAAGFVRPHYPMVAPKPLFEHYPWEKIRLPHVPSNDLEDIPAEGLAGTRNAKNPIGMYPDNQKRMWSGYYASVEFMDKQVGRILDELDRLGLSRSTAVIFTSDHGYHLGEHTFWQKGNLHEEVTRVPLVLSVPGKKPGKSRSIVELMDIFPTLAALAGLEIPEDVQGKSLMPVFDDPTSIIKDGALSFVSRGLSIRTPGWHYARYNGKSEELYDMQADPQQFTNLARSSRHKDQLEHLRTLLQEKKRKFFLK
jgi:iduronate 2-sulfatase